MLIWGRVALFVERALSLACLSSSMSESTLSSFLIQSRISLCISMSPVSMLPGEVSFELGFSVVDTRQLCQVVRQLISYSRHCLFKPSQLSSGLPTRCRLADHQSSSGLSQLVLHFEERCRLGRGGPRVRCFQCCSGGFYLPAGAFSHRSCPDLSACNQ